MQELYTLNLTTLQFWITILSNTILPFSDISIFNHEFYFCLISLKIGCTIFRFVGVKTYEVVLTI